MNSVRRRSLPDQIAEAIARRLLFRSNPEEATSVDSIEAHLASFRTSRTVVREGMMRLLASGLVVQCPRRTFFSPPLESARGVEALELEVRCADTPEQRRQAFLSWLECLRLVTSLALREAMGRRTDDVLLLKNEFERLTGVGFGSYDPLEMADASLRLIWLAAKASQNGPLLLLMNSLARSFPAIAPWLAASIQNRQLAEDWMKVEGAFRNERRDKLDDAVGAIFSALMARVRTAADHHQPAPMVQGYETHLKR